MSAGPVPARRRGIAPAVLAAVATLTVLLALGACTDATGDREAGAAAAGAGEPAGAVSGHAGLACAECHTGARGPEDVALPASDPGTCVACHAAGSLEPTVRIGEVALTHADHAGFDGGPAVACGACHTHSAGDEALRVTDGSCYLCHSESAPAGNPALGAVIPEESCLTCHGQPGHTAFTASGAVVDHRDVVERGISCVLCHYDVTEGTGAVAESTCRACHGMRTGLSPRVDASGGAAAIHAAHAPSGALSACTRCHEPIEHRVEGVASSLALDCRGCHSPGSVGDPEDPAAHAPVQQLYAGLVPHSSAAPSAKFLARVACESCHGDGAVAEPAIAGRCAGCHGEAYAAFVPVWTGAMEERVGQVHEEIERAAARPDVAAADGGARLRAAREAWTAVRDGHGVHNLAAAHGLLLQAREEIAAAYRAAGKKAPAVPSLGASPADQTCARCHYGLETRPATGDFPHGPHVLGAGLACLECHAEGEPLSTERRASVAAHGELTARGTDCRSCHHLGEASNRCAVCHADFRSRALTAPVEVTVKGKTTPRSAAWTHEKHAGVACASCHAGPLATDLAAGVTRCTDCHDSHHAAQIDCAGCHAVPSLSAAHSNATHRACDTCHSPTTVAGLVPDRALCALCHNDQAADHYEEGGLDCTSCHFLASPGEFRAHLSRGGR